MRNTGNAGRRITVSCSEKNEGSLDFTLHYSGRDYFLFREKYTVSAYNYYGTGVSLDTALDYSRSKKNIRVLKTMEKLPACIRYIEKEYDIEVLDKTKKSGRTGRAA